ncbi:helix-turn-helix domain-containing protein [Nonomuraea sp. NPDC059194]|uniref:helix-turn-helix domain-containing protein n=1 Tax=Nonomuraea sp. NPDC059194 TaxID=3346764 RepID=UPI0036868ABD
MSVQEVADYLGVPKSTVYSQWKPWGLKGYKVGRYLKFRQRNIEAWLESQVIK